MKNLANQVRAIREKQGLRQLDLASRARVSEKAIRYIEDGVPCSLRTAEKVAKGLGCKLVVQLVEG